MLFGKKAGLPVDFHSHILPCMDDGAASLKVSLSQLMALSEQGIGHVVATPHFYLHRESMADFLARRQDRAEILLQAAARVKGKLPGLSVGAEVYLEQGLMKVGGLDRLRMADTEYILFELPYSGVGTREVELIYNLCNRSGMRPLLAHLDRYREMLSEDLLAELLDLPDVAVQINNEAFAKRPGARFALNIIRNGVPVVLGSDTHNLTDRAPNFDLSNKYLSSKLRDGEFRTLVKGQIAFLHGRV